jgi:hypothetical protein
MLVVLKVVCYLYFYYYCCCLDSLNLIEKRLQFLKLLKIAFSFDYYYYSYFQINHYQIYNSQCHPKLEKLEQHD